jgi:hypothetical protein
MSRSRVLTYLTALCLALAGAPALAAPALAARAAPVTVPVGAAFTDTGGNPLHAHGGGVLKVGAYYYWFGENRNSNGTFRYVSAYRSTDLRNWEFRNHVLTQSSAAELQVANIERPKVIYNASTGQYVMWMHKENGSDYGEARAAVAVSPTVDGNYTYLRSFRPLGHMSRDITAFVDTDGTGYMISAADENYDLNIYRLNANYTDVASLARMWDGDHREAPAIFKRDGVYFLLTSGATGWQPNQAKYATATSIHSGRCADVRNQSTANNVAIVQYACNGGTNQQWRIQTIRGGYVQVIARNSGKCLDVNGVSTADYALLQQYTCGTGTNQQWTLQDAGGGYVRLAARHSGRCADLPSSSQSENVQFQQYACGGGANQQFTRSAL